MIHSSGSAITSRPELSLTTGIFWVTGFLLSVLGFSSCLRLFSVSISAISSLSTTLASLSAMSFLASFFASFARLLSSILTAANPINSPIVPLDTASSVLFLINITFAPILRMSSSCVRTVFFSVSTSLLSPIEVASKRIISPDSSASSLSLILLTLRLWV